MIIKNMTPHTITIVDADGNKIKEYPSQGLASIGTQINTIGEIDGVPLNEVRIDHAKTDILPKGYFYIVSKIYRDYFADRSDLLIVCDTVRDAEGKIIGCRSFCK